MLQAALPTISDPIVLDEALIHLHFLPLMLKV